jgi:hypothetical protein
MFKVIDSKSPAVSPKVVAQIFIIQNEMVIAGSLLMEIILGIVGFYVKDVMRLGF